jgi:aminoacyl tRNA synthase complex-interacting multifunctional protein 1
VRKSAEALAPAFNFVPLDFSTAPRIERKALDTRKKEKPPKSTENSASPAPAASKAEGSETKPVKKKEKQGAVAGKDEKKKAAEKTKATPAVAEDAGSPIPSMIDLRVGHIVEGTSARPLSHLIWLTIKQLKSTLMPMVFMSRHATSVA